MDQVLAELQLRRTGSPPYGKGSYDQSKPSINSCEYVMWRRPSLCVCSKYMQKAVPGSLQGPNRTGQSSKSPVSLHVTLKTDPFCWDLVSSPGNAPCVYMDQVLAAHEGEGVEGGYPRVVTGWC